MPLIRERVISPPSEYSQEVRDFSSLINIPPVLGSLLMGRGVDTFEKARNYFRPSLEQLNDPFMIPQMDVAVERICSCIDRGELIALYGDYDVDGITSCALVYRSLSKLGAKIRTYIPNRLEEGYGLSTEGIKEISGTGAKLILTVDCGTTACEEVDLANKLGMDVIITDHHEAGSKLPSSFALLNPKIPGSGYPDRELAGVGVAFKFVQAVYAKKGLAKEDAYEFLDIVALGTAADIVPLIGENRILVKYGFERMQETSNTGLRELITESGLNGKAIKTNNIVFSLAPMINAVGRLGNPTRAFNLLITEDRAQASNIVRLLRLDNERRKEIDKLVTKEAIAMAEESVDFQKDRVIVLASENWHVGVIGIVASRLVERFYRPTVLISIGEDGIGKGSARSISGFHLSRALSLCEKHLIKYGGHKYAAGITIQKDSIKDFREKLNEVAHEELKGHPMVPVVEPCGHCNFDDVDARFMKLLHLLEPFGPGNNRPVFYSDNIRIAGKPAKVGQNHLKFSAVRDGVAFDAIAFGMSDRRDELDKSFNNFAIAFGLEENTWKGTTRIQLRIKGIDL